MVLRMTTVKVMKDVFLPHSLSLCPLRVLDEILQKLVHLVQEEDCVSGIM